MADQSPVVGDGDDARLLGNDHGDGVGLFGYGDGGAVARTQVGVKDGGLNGQDAPGGHYAVAPDYYRAVVERRVRKEDSEQ